MGEVGAAGDNPGQPGVVQGHALRHVQEGERQPVTPSAVGQGRDHWAAFKHNYHEHNNHYQYNKFQYLCYPPATAKGDITPIGPTPPPKKKYRSDIIIIFL